MGISIHISNSLSMKVSDLSIILSTSDDRWVVALEFAPELIELYEEGYGDGTYSLGETPVLTQYLEEIGSEYNRNCEYCQESFESSEDPAYSLHKSFDEEIFFHVSCFSEFVEDVNGLVEKNKHIYTVCNI